MIEQQLSELTQAIAELRESNVELTNANIALSNVVNAQLAVNVPVEAETPTAEQPKSKVKTKAKAKPEPEPEPEPDTDLTHDDIIPLVQALSKKDRTRAKQIVTTYGERLTAIDVADLPALKSDIEQALAE